MRSMKKLLIPLVLLVVLIVVTAVGMIIKNATDTEPSESDGNTGFLFVSNDDIQRFNVTSKEGNSITFVHVVDPEDNSNSWELDGATVDYELDQSAIASYVSLLSSYTYNSVISDPMPLEEYGLADPDFTVTIEKTDGSVTHAYVGSYSYDASNCYCMAEGDPNVYLVAALKRDYCAYTLEDFRSTHILDLDYTNIDTIEFIRTSDDLDLMISCDAEPDSSPEFNITSPFERGTNGFFDNTLEFFAKLNVTGFMDISPVEIAQYRLEEPAYTLIFTLDNGNMYTITLSDNMAGYYYGSCTGYDGYFKIDSTTLGNGGLEMPLINMIDNDVVSFQANEISSIEGTYGDESFTFEISCIEDMTEEGATATLNMRNAYVETSSGRTYAAFLFENLVTIEISGADLTATPDLESEMSFTYRTTGYQTTTVDFVVRDNNSYFVFIDGEYTGFYVYSDELFHYGGTDTYDYGAWSAYLLTRQAIDNAINNIYDMPEESESAT